MEGDQFTLFYAVANLKVKEMDIRQFISIRHFKTKDHNLLLKVLKKLFQVIQNGQKATNDQLLSAVMKLKLRKKVMNTRYSTSEMRTYLKSSFLLEDSAIKIQRLIAKELLQHLQHEKAVSSGSDESQSEDKQLIRQMTEQATIIKEFLRPIVFENLKEDEEEDDEIYEKMKRYLGYEESQIKRDIQKMQFEDQFRQYMKQFGI